MRARPVLRRSPASTVSHFGPKDMETKTLVLALALGNLSLCAALFFFEYERKKILTQSSWALAKQCQAAAWFLVYFRGILPDLLSVPFASALLFAGVAIEAGALWEAADRQGWRRITLPLLALGIIIYFACYLIDLTPGMRLVAGSLIVAGFYLSAVAALATKWRSGSMLRRFLVLAMTLLCILVAARGTFALGLPGGWNWVSNTLVQILYSVALYLLMLLTSFGYLLLTREQLQQELRRLEVVDPLTDVPNRRGLFNALAPWMALARRPGLPTALIVLDFDNFKRVNDSYGHPVGDAVLRAIIDVCKGQLRESDQPGRLGGDEFAVLLPRTNLSEAMMVAERVRAAIAGHPVKTERAMINVTASLGVTTIRADDSTVSLFKRADEALQKAKTGGRNRAQEADAPAIVLP